MGHAFSDAERELLDLPETYARLGTIMRDGSPQVTVMWFRREGNTLRMVCEPEAVKARNIACDGRVALAVERPGMPYVFLQVRGRAQVVHDDKLAWDEACRLARRYLAERADAYIATIEGSRMVTIIVHPERTSAFVGTLATVEGSEQ